MMSLLIPYLKKASKKESVIFGLSSIGYINYKKFPKME